VQIESIKIADLVPYEHNPRINDKAVGKLANSTQIAINERGEVMYCCHKPYEIVGHVMDENILEKKQEYFTNIAKCDVPCRLTAPNEMMLKMADVPNDWMFI
jgi:hypothetical protein